MQLNRSKSIFTSVLALLFLATGPASAITVLNTTNFSSAGNQSATTLATGYSVAGVDKLVVLIAGEGNFGNTARTLNSVTYNGIAMNLAVKLDNNPGHPGYAEAVAGIFFLDNPGSIAASGNIVLNVGIGSLNARAATILSLGGTAAGVGPVNSSLTASTSLNTLIDGSFVVAVGQANNGTLPTPQAPLTNLHVFNGSTFDAGFGSQLVSPSGLVTPTFIAGTTPMTLAAAFAPAAVAAIIPEPATATLALIGLGGLMMRRRREDASSK